MNAYLQAQADATAADIELHKAREAYYQAQEKAANAHQKVSILFAARHQPDSEWPPLYTATEAQRRSLAYMGQG